MIQKRKVKTIGVCMLPMQIKELDEFIKKRNPHQNRSNFVNEAIEYYLKILKT